MRILLFFTILLIAVVGCSAPSAPTATPNTSAILTATAPQSKTTPASPSSAAASVSAGPVLVVAHRGGAALAPENTLGAFENAIKLGVDMVETDVHLSKDGEVVVMHDPDVSTTTNGSGQISELTLAELKKLNAAAKFKGGSTAAQPIPTLAEVLDTVKGKTGIQIEIKVNAANARYPGIEQKVIDLIHARGMTDSVIIISFDFPTLKEVKAIDPKIKTGALARADYLQRLGNDPDRAVADVIATTGADYFMPTSGIVTEALVRATHAKGLKFGVWTVDAPQDMKRFAGYGVDAITTDSPDQLKAVLGK